MKKFALALSTAMLCSVMSVSAQQFERIVPVGCPVQQQCAQPCEPQCTCNEQDVCAMKQQYLDKRCCVYKKVGMTDAQSKQARCIDEKFFDEMHPLKDCYCKEKAKLKDMECKKVCEADIKCQKEKVRDLKKQLKAKKKAHHEAILCLLNDCQQKTYKKICKENKKKYEKKDDCECRNY